MEPVDWCMMLCGLGIGFVAVLHVIAAQGLLCVSGFYVGGGVKRLKDCDRARRVPRPDKGSKKGTVIR